MSETTYEAVRSYIITDNAPNGSVLDFITCYDPVGKKRSRRADAILEGFHTWGHDDFNIAVWRDGQLVSWDWMDEPVDTEPDVLVQIERELRSQTGDYSL